MSEQSNRLLTDEQLKDGVEMFANGKNRTEVAQYFLDNVPHLQEQDATDPKGIRKRLSNALRVADPTSKQFSGKKYGEHLALHRSAKKEALQEKYKRAVLKYADFLEKQIEQGQERIEALTYLHDKASEEIPRGNPETLATDKTRASIVEQQARLHKELQETLKTINTSVDTTGETT